MFRFCKVWNFAQNYTEFMTRYYISVLSVPENLPLARVAPSSSTFSIDVGRYLIYLCRCLRERFEALYQPLQHFEALTEEQLMRFCIARCETFCTMQDCMSLMIACAFISELNNYLFLKDCYGLDKASWKCFLAVFRRQLISAFHSQESWERLRLFCRDMNLELIPSTFHPIIDLNLNHFTRYSLKNERNSLEEYITNPITQINGMDTFPALTNFERVLLSCDLNSPDHHLFPSCGYCFGPCIMNKYSAGVMTELSKN